MSNERVQLEVLYSGGAVQLYTDTSPTTLIGPKGDDGVQLGPEGRVVVDGQCVNPPTVTDPNPPIPPGDPPPHQPPPTIPVPNEPEPLPVTPPTDADCGSKYVNVETGTVYEMKNAAAEGVESTEWNCYITTRKWPLGLNTLETFTIEKWTQTILNNSNTEQWGSGQFMFGKLNAWYNYIDSVGRGPLIDLGTHGYVEGCTESAYCGRDPGLPCHIHRSLNRTIFQGGVDTKPSAIGGDYDYWNCWQFGPVAGDLGKWGPIQEHWPCTQGNITHAHRFTNSVSSGELDPNIGQVIFVGPTQPDWAGKTFPVPGDNSFSVNLNVGYYSWRYENKPTAYGQVEVDCDFPNLIVGQEYGYSKDGYQYLQDESSPDWSVEWDRYQPGGDLYASYTGTGAAAVGFGAGRHSCTWVAIDQLSQSQIDEMDPAGFAQGNPTMAGISWYQTGDYGDNDVESEWTWSGDQWYQTSPQTGTGLDGGII